MDNNLKREIILDNYQDTKNTYDAIIVDPPRSGLDKKTKSGLLKIKSKKIIYVFSDHCLPYYLQCNVPVKYVIFFSFNNQSSKSLSSHLFLNPLYKNCLPNTTPSMFS